MMNGGTQVLGASLMVVRESVQRIFEDAGVLGQGWRVLQQAIQSIARLLQLLFVLCGRGGLQVLAGLAEFLLGLLVA